MKTTTRPILSYLLTMIACISASVAVQAGTGNDRGYSETVKLADLDLNTAEGTRVMHERLNRATFRICRAQSSGKMDLEFARCRTRLRRAAVSEVERAVAAAKSAESHRSVSAGR